MQGKATEVEWEGLSPSERLALDALGKKFDVAVDGATGKVSVPKVIRPVARDGWATAANEECVSDGQNHAADLRVPRTMRATELRCRPRACAIAVNDRPAAASAQIAPTSEALVAARAPPRGAVPYRRLCRSFSSGVSHRRLSARLLLRSRSGKCAPWCRDAGRGPTCASSTSAWTLRHTRRPSGPESRTRR